MKDFRPTQAVIDTQALSANLDQIKNKMNRGSRVMAIVKANAYGHGARAVVRKLTEEGVRDFGVATLEEALEIKDEATSIYVLGGLFGDTGQVFLENNFIPVIHQWGDLEKLGVFLQKVGKSHTVHLKFDTGMGRLGFFEHEWEAVFKALEKYPQIKVEGLMTHLARADEPDFAPTEKQFLVFRELQKKAMQTGIRIFHVANSAAIIEQKTLETQMVRPGIMLYGAHPHKRHESLVDLKPVMTFKTGFLGIKKHPPGSSLSYGGTFVTSRESLIGLLPVGYADGYPRLLSNRASVLVRGERAPVVGRVCMDLTLVDVTDIQGVQESDEVVLFGRQGDDQIRVEEVAAWAQTISYEILCGISKRVPRVYL